MGFMDDIKRSLGYEETESGSNVKGIGSSIMDMVRDVLAPRENQAAHQHNPHQYNPNQGYEVPPTHTTAPNPNYRPTPKEAPVTQDYEEDYDDYVIIPEQSFYEIVLIRPKTIYDINYVVDQVIEEQNPVILDLSFLEKESAPNYKLAGDKIKQMRTRYGAQALLLSRSDDKNLILISPRKVKVINKGR